MFDNSKMVETMIQRGISRGGINKNLIIQDVWGVYHDNGINISIERVSVFVNEIIERLKLRNKIILINDVIFSS